MGDLVRDQPTVPHPITTLKIPGSHNSFTNNVYPDLGIGPDFKVSPALRWFCKHFGFLTRPILARWSQCQTMDVTQQLMAGIRYFDFRVGIYKPKSSGGSSRVSASSSSKKVG